MEKSYKKIRRDVLMRDKYCCQICFSKKNLGIRQISEPLSTGLDSRNFITLCKKCFLQIQKEKRSSYATVKHKDLKMKKNKARVLYRQGMTTREVGQIVGRSHTWVWRVIHEAGLVDKKLDKN